MLDTIFWDNELIQHYALDSISEFPRHAQLQPSVNQQAVEQALKHSQRQLKPLALLLQLPSSENAEPARYLADLNQEAALVASFCDPRQHVEQLHLQRGGLGFFNAAQLHSLMHNLQQHFTLLEDDSGDYRIDLDPCHADWSSMGLLRQMGFNHVCLSLPKLTSKQQLNDALKQTSALAEAARTLAFKTLSLSIDYGVPKQSSADFSQQLQQLIALQADRLILRPYLSPSDGVLPSRALRLRLFKQSLEQLTGAGYRYIAPGLFSLLDDELAIAQEEGTLSNNLYGYSAHGKTVQLGLGLAACGQVEDLAYQNHRDLARYQQALERKQLPIGFEHHSNPQERICNEAIEQLRCRFRIDAEQLPSGAGLSLQQHFTEIWPQLRDMASAGVLSLNEQRLTLLPAGRLLIESCCLLLQKAAQPQLELGR